MNYRHAFHAGNFADVMKHVLLARVLVHLCRKESAFRVIDTHAGVGVYDLEGEEADRTQEWRGGIGRLTDPFSVEVEELIEPYRALIERLRGESNSAYPGSPAVMQAFLRLQDRAILAELHPADFAVLGSRFARDRRVKVLHLDGWTALHAFVPPKERRGLVLIDPPYEEPGELQRLAVDMANALGKWPTGIFMGWYPIKDPAEVDPSAALLAAAAGVKGLRLELLVDSPHVPTQLNGCGLFVLNPPWMLREEAELILPALAERLARGSYGAYRCEPLAH